MSLCFTRNLTALFNCITSPLRPSGFSETSLTNCSPSFSAFNTCSVWSLLSNLKRLSRFWCGGFLSFCQILSYLWFNWALRWYRLRTHPFIRYYLIHFHIVVTCYRGKTFRIYCSTTWSVCICALGGKITYQAKHSQIIGFPATYSRDLSLVQIIPKCENFNRRSCCK